MKKSPAQGAGLGGVCAVQGYLRFDLMRWSIQYREARGGKDVALICHVVSSLEELWCVIEGLVS